MSKTREEIQADLKQEHELLNLTIEAKLHYKSVIRRKVCVGILTKNAEGVETMHQFLSLLKDPIAYWVNTGYLSFITNGYDALSDSAKAQIVDDKDSILSTLKLMDRITGE